MLAEVLIGEKLRRGCCVAAMILKIIEPHGKWTRDEWTVYELIDECFFRDDGKGDLVPEPHSLQSVERIYDDRHAAPEWSGVENVAEIIFRGSTFLKHKNPK